MSSFLSGGRSPDIFVPTFDMKISDASLATPIAKMITEISVTQYLDPPHSFRFRLVDPKLDLIDRVTGPFTEGAKIEISLGFVGNTSTLISGEITALNPDFPNSGPAILEVEGFDFLWRLTRGTVYRHFDGPTPDSGKADSEIATQIANEMGLSPDVDPTPPLTQARVQSNVTNLTFLQSLANLNNYSLWCDGSTLHFKQNRPAPSSLSLEWGKTLMSFSPRLSTAGQVNSVEVRGWDPKQKQSFTVTVQRSDTTSISATGLTQLSMGAGGQSKITITDAPVADAHGAEAYAQSILQSQQKTLISGQGTSIGQPSMQVGSILTLSGVGRFSRTYTVQRATHTLGENGYQTSFEVLLTL